MPQNTVPPLQIRAKKPNSATTTPRSWYNLGTMTKLTTLHAAKQIAIAHKGDRTMFRRDYPDAYSCIQDGELWAEVGMEPPRNISWTKAEVLKRATALGSLPEFRRRHEGAYRAAKKQGWLEGFKWKSSKVSNTHYWTELRCKGVASICDNEVELHLLHPAALRSIRKNGYIVEYKGLK